MRIALLEGAGAQSKRAAKSAEVYVSSLAKALRERGHETHVFRPESVRCSGYQQFGGIHYHAISSEAKGTSAGRLAETMLYYVQQTQGVAGRFDVVHAHDRALLPVLDEMKAVSRPKVVLTLHTEAGLISGARPALDQHWILLGSIDGLTTSSRALRRRLVERFPVDGQDIPITYPGVDQEKYSRWVDVKAVKRRVGLNEGDQLILFIGELTRSLGPDLLLEAFFDVRSQWESAGLVFVGDGPMAPYLKERANVLGIKAKVQFLGFVSEEQIIDLYNASDIVCVPARSAQLDQTVLEAWSAGKPAIISQQSAPEFLEAQFNGLAPKAETAAVAHDVALCLRDRVLAADLGKRGWLKVSNELSWSALARRFEGIYEA